MLMILILISIVVIFVSHIYVVLLGFCYCICYICYKYIIILTFSHKTSILKMSEILNPSYRAIFSYNSVLYIIHIIIRSLYLSVNSTFNTLYIIRVNHSLKAVARQFTKLCILLASKHINNHTILICFILTHILFHLIIYLLFYCKPLLNSTLFLCIHYINVKKLLYQHS